MTPTTTEFTVRRTTLLIMKNDVLRGTVNRIADLMYLPQPDVVGLCGGREEYNSICGKDAKGRTALAVTRGLWNEIPNAHLRGILAHELVHLSRHMDGDDRRTIHEEEYEADRLAAEAGFRKGLLASFRWMIEHGLDAHRSYPTFAQRIKALEKPSSTWEETGVRDWKLRYST